MKPLLTILSSFGLLIIIAAGCAEDPLVEHKIRTNFFDGVPDLPPLEQLCKDNMGDLFNKYYEERLSEAESGSLEEEKIITAGSSHPPYAEKNCQGCHDFKNKNLLLAPVFRPLITLGFLRHNNKDEQAFCSKFHENIGGERRIIL